MGKQILFFGTITMFFIGLGIYVKSNYYFLPYPNLIEYFLSFVLLLITLIWLLQKPKKGKKKKLLIGFVSILLLTGCIHLLNLAFKWHPTGLKPPIINSQSVEVDFEPYQWEMESPENMGYTTSTLSGYFEKLDKWDRLRGLLIVKEDKLIVEKYFSDATKYSAFNVHSVTKSITSALVGLAIEQHHIASEDDLVLPFFPEHQYASTADFKNALTIKHLLSMRGGWAAGDGFQTVDQCITKELLSAMPGTEFNYFTGSQNILSAIVTKSTKQSTKEFAEQYLFQPLGIKNAFWRKIEGYYVGGDESYFTARDLARFGQLYINYGNVEGKQLLDSTWVNKTFTNYTPTSKVFRALDSYEEVGYGFCWWVLKTPDNSIMYAARGKGGQHIILIPEKKIVAVVIQEWNPLKKNGAVENKLLGELLGIL
ncbi:serine hydrolase domain-containing protein [Pleomorphovibrio marinus]|uniref:serine hydrolase domain-containing protein n=1 Tax=Pleomorphovibrio marinus TaxID=2164132 RepID=UPI000E0A1492|nr:serine hydrolase [Pleomorphovibrio marinus]